MIKEYRKISTIKAEQFDGSDEMIKKYDMDVDEIGCCAIRSLEGYLKLSKGDWIATGSNGEHWPIRDDIFKKTYQEVGSKKKIVKAVQFDSWDEDMMQRNYIDNPDYWIYLININGLQVYLNQDDWIVTYQDGSQDVIPDEEWEKNKWV